jgi:cell division protein FtsB
MRTNKVCKPYKYFYNLTAFVAFQFSETVTCFGYCFGFDKYSFIDRLQLRSKINQLENEQKYYREKIEEDKRKKEELLGNRDNLEKFAREQYLMKRENEDIFIIVKE